MAYDDTTGIGPRAWRDWNPMEAMTRTVIATHEKMGDERLTEILHSCGVDRKPTPTELLLARILQCLEAK